MAAWGKRKANWTPKRAKNGTLGISAKRELRSCVLDALGAPEARVLDLFCGPVGEMHAAVWVRAGHYVGVDTAWRREDARRRFVAPAATVLRATDLAPFNVFDLDAFGSPWTEAVILAARRRWAPGERGALVLTDGSDGYLKWGGHVGALADLVGPAHHKTLREPQQRAALAAWCQRAGVVAEQVWLSRGYSNPTGGQVMQYAGVVFRGL